MANPRPGDLVTWYVSTQGADPTPHDTEAEADAAAATVVKGPVVVWECEGEQ